MATAQATATRSAAHLPFGALAPLMRGALPVPGSIDDRFDLLRQAANGLAEHAEGAPLLLFVDDAHMLDEASATLVHQVAAAEVATVLATVAVGEAAPDPIVALWKDGVAARVDIAGLPSESTEELLTEVLDRPVDPATAGQFFERCQGNVLFLRELVVGALDDGSLRDDGGIWRLQRPLLPSARLVEIVEARLGRLQDDERALLELVSYGEPLGQAELALLSDPALAERLERRDLLTSTMDGRRLQVRLAHPIYGDVIRSRTPALRARSIAQSLAEAMEKTRQERHEDALRLATWQLQGGDGDPHLLLAGAEIARMRYDLPLAESLAQAAADTGAGFDAALLAAHLASTQGRWDEAERTLMRLADEVGDDRRRSQVAIARLDNILMRSGHDEGGILDEAKRSVSDPEWLDQLEARRLGVLLLTEGPQRCLDAARPLIKRGQGEVLVFALQFAAFSLARLGQLDDALETADEAQRARKRISGPMTWYPWWHTVTRCLALLYAGRFDDAAKTISEHYGEALAEGSIEAQAIFGIIDASAVTDRGSATTATRRAREAIGLHQQLGRTLLVRENHIVAALALAVGGHAREAADELASLDTLGPLPRVRLDEVDLLRARAWAAAAAGDIPVASQQLQHAADLGRETGNLVPAATALHELARLGRPAEARDRLAHIADRIDGGLARARAAHVDALASGDAEALSQVSEAFEEMGATLLAAEASADTAAVRRRMGAQREAAQAESRASVLASRCEGPVTPALQAIEVRARLTPAERETAMLAASGRSNREIAAQLFLSSRTIENRLQRVYEKLGISGRAELAEALSLED